MKLVVKIDGGIGRCICAIPALEKLAKTYHTIILTGYPELFDNNPNFYKVYPLSNKYLWEDVISTNDYLEPEPYKSYHYYAKKDHLITVFNRILNKDAEFFVGRPNLYLTPEEISWAKDVVGNHRKKPHEKVLVFQPFGAAIKSKEVGVINNNLEGVDPKDPLYQSLQLINQLTTVEYYDDTYRSLNTKQAKYILEHCKHNLIYMGDIDLGQSVKYNLRQWIAIISQADGVIGIDSCAQHIAYAFDKRSLVFWGSTAVENLGYGGNENFYLPGYPKEYIPFRFTQDFSKNKGAMDYPIGFLEEKINGFS